ncbi:MAG: response regulator [Oscillospiraceae bacterium]
MALKILICDDSLFVRKKMKDTISKLGITDIIEAADGQQAVEKYKAEKPDLCFMDIIMPVKSGVDALKEIREFDKGAKVIMASSVGTQANLKEAIIAGAYDFLQKPIEDAAVKKIIDKITG